MSKQTENAEQIKNRTELQKEINENKLNIDYSVFKKTSEEKEELKRRKKAYKLRAHV